MSAIWFLVIVGGVLGYSLAARAKRVFGVSPWRVHPIVWGLVCALVPVLGIVLETVAQFTTRPPLPPSGQDLNDRNPFGGYRGQNQTVTTGWHQADPRAGEPWSHQPARPTASQTRPGDPSGDAVPAVPVLSEAQPGERRLPGPGGWKPGEAGDPVTGPPPLFGWYADPTGSHEKRYWDGRHWWDSVMDGDVRSEDPLPV